jgi:Tfp pilus assembly protein PilN
MDIDINLLPEEIRPKPLLNARMLLLLVVVGVLGFGCYYFYDLKAGTEADAAVAESRIEAVEDEASDLANNAEAKEIVAGISEAKATLAELEAATSDYVVFKDSRIGWGEVVDRVAIRLVGGITLESIVASGSDVVEVGGVASSYERAAAYASSLELDDSFDNVHTREWEGTVGRFLLSIDVVTGGAE